MSGTETPVMSVTARLVHWLEPQDHSVGTAGSVRLAWMRIGWTGGIFRSFRRDVFISVRALAHIADARVELSEQRFAPLSLRRGLIEGDALKLLAIQRVYEEVPFPVRETVAGNKR
jgi:hypothetical protein